MTLFLINLVFILHNMYRYIYGLKIYGSLIVIFYVLILVSTICRIVETIVRILQPGKAFFSSTNVVGHSAEETALASVVCLGFILIITMHQLTMSLQAIRYEIQAN